MLGFLGDSNVEPFSLEGGTWSWGAGGKWARDTKGNMRKRNMLGK